MAGLTSTPELVIGIAAGAAASAALEPALEIPKQDAWNSAANRILDEGLLARLVASGGVDLGTAQYFARRNGYAQDQFGALVYLAQTVPGVAEAMHLWRLGLISDADFRHSLVKAGLDQRYIDPIIKTKTEELLGLGDIAIAVVRGILPAPSYVPVPVPATGDKVPRYPQVPLDPEVLAAKIGYTPEALQVMVGRSGLSLAPVMAAQALFRGLIGSDDFLIAIGEGDLRTEWADTVEGVARQILTAEQYADLQIRGYLTRDQRLAGTAKHGMTCTDSDLLYNVLGRGLSLHQAFVAERRGGVFQGPTDAIPDWAMYQLQRGNLRPEVYNLAWAARETYPSYFVTRALLQAGAITAQRGQELFSGLGWPQDVADAASNVFSGGSGTTADAHVAKAQTQLWTTTHRGYVAGGIDDTDATKALTAAGVQASSIPEVLTLWQEERSLDRKRLSAAQVKKAWVEQVVNPATGAAWTRDEALAYLIELGYNPSDAATFLEL